MKQQSAFLAMGIAIGISIGTIYSVNAASTSTAINLCVNKKTNVVSQKAKCSSLERVLSISRNGIPGPAGSPGPSGPPGSSSSGLNLASYPSLWGEVDAIANATCQNKWDLLIGAYNIESDEFGQPVRNKPWALNLAGSCKYPMPEIFELPKVIEITNIVHGTKSLVAASNVHSVPSYYSATISSMKLKLQLDTGWHLCTSADAQYTPRGLATRQTGWTQTAANEVTFSGSRTVTWSTASDPTDFANFSDTDTWPWFCGADDRTSSGLGYRSFNI